MIKQGLQETIPDERDFQLGALVRLPKLSELPNNFCLKTLGIKDQGDSDYCTAFTSCTVSEIQEGVELSPEYSFALSKLLTKDPETWGQNIRDALKAHTKIGAIEQREAPYTLKDTVDEWLRRFENWPPHLISKTQLHRKKSYSKITGPYDHFDNIRASIWKFHKESRGVVSGLKWSWPLETHYLTGTENEGFGHCIAYIGWSDKGLVLQNSAGREAGVEGCHLVSRETVNHFVENFGAYMLIDLTPDEVKYYVENGIKLGDNWIVAIFKAIISLFKRK